MGIIRCPLCSSDSFQVIYPSTLTTQDYKKRVVTKQLKNTLDSSNKHGRYVRCKICSLLYVNPRESQEIFDEGYIDVIDKEYLETERYRQIISWLHLKRIDAFSKNDAILDVGCFTGQFLQSAKKDGWKTCHGIELSKWAIKIAEKRGIKIIGSNIFDTKLTDNFYDAITLWDVIEHLEKPHTVIKKLKKALKKNGIIAIGTPDIDSTLAKILKQKLPYLVRMHIMLYSLKTLTMLLEKNGFQIVSNYYYGRMFPLSYILDKSPINSRIKKILLNLTQSLPILRNMVINLNLRDTIAIVAIKQ